jgi:type II secretory ATPase GspE/PulE/Tfp pilus assembly ATPase PilB-like protein
VRVIAAQRLVRKICEHCKEVEHIPDNIVARVKEALGDVSAEEMRKYGLDPDADFVFHHGVGCKKCGGLGLVGRLAIYEAIEIDREMQDLISEEEGNMLKAEKLARKKGFITLKQDGILKMLLGMTTLAELERVTEGDMSIGGKIDEIEDEEEMHQQLSQSQI